MKPLSKALARGPSQIDPKGRLFDVADFPRDVQPILDRHCVKCHNPDQYTARVNLSGDHGTMYSFGYLNLITRNQVFDGRNLAQSDWPPYARGSGGSPLMKKIDGSHHGVKVSPLERTMIMQWLDASAPYAGTYAALGCGFISASKCGIGYKPSWWYTSNPGSAAAVKSRCVSCHTTPTTISDGTRVKFHDPKDPRSGRTAQTSSHTLYNLTRPEKSIYLMAPLAKSAGGLGLCTNGLGKAVFESTQDPDYQKLLAMVKEAKANHEAEPRFDQRNFCPNREYIREMKRYGILPADYDPSKAKLDAYQIDRLYWDLDWTDLK